MKSWIVYAMDTAPQEGNLHDVVKTVHWRRKCEEVDQDGKSWYAETFGMASCPSPSETDFTAYPDLTEAIVFGWLDNLVDVQAADDYLDAKILEQKNPPIYQLPLPWVPQPVPPVIVPPVEPAPEEGE